jgi:hypothetical protein
VELKAVFLDQISKAMDESGEFNGNLSYPWVKWDFSLKFTSYPKFAVDSELQEVVNISEVIPAGDIPPLEIQDENTKIVVVAPEEPLVIDTPDQARVDADLPLPTPVPVVNVGVVDKPIKQQTSKRGK